jgi:hypothetical protein
MISRIITSWTATDEVPKANRQPQNLLVDTGLAVIEPVCDPDALFMATPQMRNKFSKTTTYGIGATPGRERNVLLKRSDRKERRHVIIRSLTPEQATGNVLAIAVHLSLLCVHWQRNPGFLSCRADASPEKGLLSFTTVLNCDNLHSLTAFFQYFQRVGHLLLC